MLKKIILVALFTLVCIHAEKPTVAVMELTGSGLTGSQMLALTNRLGTELFKADSFTVIERGEMDEILREQGFQQTGCTDAACAIEAGQLLNAQYIIVGSVDKVENVYSLNVRQVDVGSGEVVRNVSTDCFDCSLEDVFVESVRRAALLLAGVSKEKVDELVPSVHVRKTAGTETLDYKGEKSEKSGSVAIKVLPDECRIFLDKESYGSGTKAITNVPVGKHTVKVFREDLGRTVKRKTHVFKDAQSDVEIRLDRDRFFRLGLGFSTEFVLLDDWVDIEWLTVPRSYSTVQVKKIQNNNMVFNIGYKTVHHYFGLRFKYGYLDLNAIYRDPMSAPTGVDPNIVNGILRQGDYEAEALSFDGTSYTESRISYDMSKGSIGAFLEYAYSFRFFKYLLTVEPGVNLGLGLLSMGLSIPDLHDNSVSYSDVYRVLDASSTEGHWAGFFYQKDIVEFGGSNVAVTFGTGKTRITGRYDLTSAVNFNDNEFLFVHEIQFAATVDF